MPFATGGYTEQRFRFSYLGEDHMIKSKQEIKVNGILIQQELNPMKDSNVGQIIVKMGVVGVVGETALPLGEDPNSKNLWYLTSCVPDAIYDAECRTP